MVIMAYALSVFMLMIGSDVFYDISSKAAGIGVTTDEETPEKINKDLPDLQDADLTSLLIQSKLQKPFGIAEITQTGLGNPDMVKEDTEATIDLQEGSDTNWLLGSAMSTQEFESIMQQVTTYDSEGKDEKLQAEQLMLTADPKSTSTARKVKKNEIFSLSKEASGTYVLNVTDEEIDMLERIVQAEAGGEDLKGKILIVNVILNRIKDEDFPDTIEDVIFQNKDGEYQFSPVEDERYWKVKISDNTEEAVQRALKGEDYSEGALYFIARKRTNASSAAWFDNHLKWLFKHGGHEFYK
jgi:N-acetylmuramoyl-L-alanine amidase